MKGMAIKMRRNKLKKNVDIDKYRLSVGGIVAALVAAVALFGAMLQIEKNMLTRYEKGPILVAAKEIPKGQLITEENAENFFVTKELDKSCIPESSLTDIGIVQGMVAENTIEEGVLVTTGMFEQMEEILQDINEPVVAGCKAEDLYQIVGGVLRSGDRVHIYSVSDEGEVSLVWQNVFVQQVFDSAGGIIGNENTTSAAQRINIYLEKSHVEQFYSELAKGSLRVVKVCKK